MKYWILCLLRIKKKLAAVVDRIDKEVSAYSLDLKCDTLKLYDAILELNDKKILIINLKVLIDKILSSLCNDERILLLSYASGVGLDELAFELKVSRSTVLRRLAKIFKRCALEMESIGYTEKQLENDYLDFELIKRELQKIRRHYDAKSKFITLPSDGQAVLLS